MLTGTVIPFIGNWIINRKKVDLNKAKRCNELRQRLEKGESVEKIEKKLLAVLEGKSIEQIESEISIEVDNTLERVRTLKEHFKDFY